MNQIYGVLYTDGTFKVGKTGDSVRRINEHLSTGKKYSKSHLCFFLSEKVCNADQEEKNLIRLAKKHLECVSGEYFAGCTFETAKKISISTNLLFCCGKSIKRSPDGAPLVELYIPGEESDTGAPKKFKNRVLSAISKCGFHGITEGMLNNKYRTRTAEVRASIAELLDEGAISEEIYSNEKGRKVRKFKTNLE